MTKKRFLKIGEPSLVQLMNHLGAYGPEDQVLIDSSTLTGRTPHALPRPRLSAYESRRELPPVLLEANYSQLEQRILASLLAEPRKDDTLEVLSALSGLSEGLQDVGPERSPASGRDRCEKCGRSGAVRVTALRRAGRGTRTAVKMLCGLHGG